MGDRHQLPAGRIYERVPALGSSAHVALPAPIALVSPNLGTSDAPPESPLAGLKVSWNAGQPWQLVRVELLQSRGPNPGDRFDWWVSGSGGERSFTFFRLPADVGSAGFQPGAVEITAYAQESSDRSSLESYYGATQNFAADGSGAAQTVHGFATLQ